MRVAGTKAGSESPYTFCPDEALGFVAGGLKPERVQDGG